jgi:hypothetical protein
MSMCKETDEIHGLRTATKKPFGEIVQPFFFLFAQATNSGTFLLVWNFLQPLLRAIHSTYPYNGIFQKILEISANFSL